MSAGHLFMGLSFLGLLVMAVLAVIVIGKALTDESNRRSKPSTKRRSL